MNFRTSTALLSGACLLSGCAVSRPLICDVQSITICESAVKPGHLAWPKPFLDKEGNLCVIFQQISGDLSRSPSYDFRQHPENYQIKLICMQAEPGSSEFEMIWEKPTTGSSSFFIPVPTPAPDGTMLAVCRLESSREFAGLPEKCVIILQSDDCGRTFTRRSVIAIPGIPLNPNDIKYIGNRLYLATYGQGKAHLFYSDDDGASWSEPLEIVRPHDNMSFHEPTFCELSNGDLLVIMRTHRMDIPKHNGINYQMVIIRKNPDGSLTVVNDESPLRNNYIFDEQHNRHLSPVMDTNFGFRGRPYLQRLSSGEIFFVAPGSFAAISKDDGASWYSGMADFQLRKVEITDRFGTKPYNWNAETMILELPDGRIFYSYFIGSDLPFPPPCDMYIGGAFFRIASGE